MIRDNFEIVTEDSKKHLTREEWFAQKCEFTREQFMNDIAYLFPFGTLAWFILWLGSFDQEYRDNDQKGRWHD